MKKKHIILLILLLILGSIMIYMNTYYKSSKEVNNYLKSDDNVSVKLVRNGYFFDGPGNDTILVFYPGARVEYTAYAPLMRNLATMGIDTFIVKMPFNFAFFKMNAIKDVMNNYDYEKWFIGGHSLGGVVAAMDASNNDVRGLILVASYATQDINCKVLSIYGSNDGVLNLKKYEDNKKFLANNRELIIEGGNHAYFGNYGEQHGDKLASISRKEQQEQAVEEIYRFIREE